MNERPQSSIPTRWIMAWTIVLWALGTSVYAYIYVTSRVRLPDAVGYEADWSWQLFFFSLVRLPISYRYSVRCSTSSTCLGHEWSRRTGLPNKPLEWPGMNQRRELIEPVLDNAASS